MYGFMLFLHLAGLLVWTGSLLASTVSLLLLRGEQGGSAITSLAKRMIRVFSSLSHPSAIAVLISGIYMIVKLDLGPDKPLWLNVMEKGGGTIILLALVLTGMMGRRVKKRIAAEPEKLAVSGYIAASALLAGLIFSVVLVVSLKL